MKSDIFMSIPIAHVIEAMNFAGLKVTDDENGNVLFMELKYFPAKFEDEFEDDLPFR